MAEQRATTKAELLADIEQSWTALNAALDQMTQVEQTGPKDAQGWTVKDHLVHLAAWERSVIFMLQGKPRHEGLGVEEDLYLSKDYDRINAEIFQQHREEALDETVSLLNSTHQQMMDLLQNLTDEDLHRPYRRYLPDEPGEGDGPPALNLIYGNTADHFAEHLEWITALVHEL
jgi:hypothetical protein